MKTIRTECDNQLAASLLVEKRKATKHIEELNAEHKETVNKIRKKKLSDQKEQRSIRVNERGTFEYFHQKSLKRNVF